MFDTMTWTKIVGGFCGSLLLFLLVSWMGESLFHGGGHGHGDEHHASYVIDTGESGGTTEEVVEVDFNELVAAADPAKGERVFNKCKACHKLEDGANGTGPHLYDVVDRDIGSVDGYGYSTAMAELEGTWTADALDGFLANPKGYLSETKMAFTGLKKIEDRANLVAYLETIGD